MNVKRFLSDSYRRGIDSRINRLVLNHQIDKTHKSQKLEPLNKLKDDKSNGKIVPRPDHGITQADGEEMYREKCADLKLLPNNLAKKRFVEQFLSGICIRSIKFSGLGIGPRCSSILIRLLHRNKQFLYVDLSRNRLGDEGGKMFARLIAADPPMIYLDMRSNSIGIEGCTALFTALASNTHLTELDMSAIGGIDRNRFGTRGCMELSTVLWTNETLSHLNIAYCGITAEGCASLGPALASNRTLISLDLTANGFQSEGAKNLFSTKHSFGCLTTLVLARNMIDDEAAEVLCRQLKKNTNIRSLDVSYNKLGRRFLSELYDALSRHGTSLESLNLAHNNFANASDSLALIIRDFPSITTFNISRNAIGDSGVKNIIGAMKKHGQVISLDLTDTEIGDDGAKEIAGFLAMDSTLQKLFLAENSITDEGGVPLVTSIADNSTLGVLSLENNELKDKTAVALLKSLEKNMSLADIDVAYNDFGCMAYVRLNKVIEEHRKVINSNMADVAVKHISVLKEKEQELFMTYDEIKTAEMNLAEKKDYNDQKQEELKASKEIGHENIEKAEKQLSDVQDKYYAISEERRMKLREFNATKLNFDRRQAEAMSVFQRLTTTRQQTQARLSRCESKQVEQKTERARELDDLEMKIEEAKNRARAVVRDVLQAKMLAIAKEQEEKSVKSAAKEKPKKRGKKDGPKIGKPLKLDPEMRASRRQSAASSLMGDLSSRRDSLLGSLSAQSSRQSFETLSFGTRSGEESKEILETVQEDTEMEPQINALSTTVHGK